MTHTFKINDRELMAVAVPENSRDFKVFYENGHTRLLYDIGTAKCFSHHTGKDEFLPNIEWMNLYLYKIVPIDTLFLYPGCSEEQAAGLVSKYQPQNHYVDYVHRDPVNGFHSAIESLASLMERQRLYVKNPHPQPESGRNKLYGSSNTSARSQAYHKDFHQRKEQWQEAESRTSPYWLFLQVK